MAIFMYYNLFGTIITPFEFTNYINVLFNQIYSNIFSDQIPVKKAFIACAHLIIFIIKLRSNRTNLTAFYYEIQSYIVVL